MIIEYAPCRSVDMDMTTTRKILLATLLGAAGLVGASTTASASPLHVQAGVQNVDWSVRFGVGAPDYRRPYYNGYGYAAPYPYQAYPYQAYPYQAYSYQAYSYQPYDGYAPAPRYVRPYSYRFARPWQPYGYWRGGHRRW